MSKYDEDNSTANIAMLGALALRGAATSPLINSLGKNVLKSNEYRTPEELKGFVDTLSNKMNLYSPEIIYYNNFNNVGYTPTINAMLIDRKLNSVPANVIAHELGHKANMDNMGKFFTNAYFIARDKGNLLSIPTGTVIISKADPDSGWAKSAPWIAATPGLVTVVEEGIASGRGLNALWKLDPSRNKLNDIKNLGKALGTYAVAPAAIIGILESTRRWKSFKKRNPDGTLKDFLFH